MWDFKLILVRVLLNLFHHHRTVINDEINELKKLGKDAKFPELFYWCGVSCILEFKAPHWSLAIKVDGKVICEDNLTNGRWGFNRSTISRLESQFIKFDQKQAFIGFENYLFENTNYDPEKDFSLMDRIFGKSKTKTIFIDNSFSVGLNEITRTVQGKYLIKNLVIYFPDNLDGILDLLIPWNLKSCSNGLVFNSKEELKNYCIDNTVTALKSLLHQTTVK
ncbi:hypothetical protein [Aeromonas phage ZPAH34]|uniref:hypothetical protein n=1 Tax=Aeromonas phage ZPAH34 TaxID=2924888 RepID=UPI0023297909|nr:hypothetical protein PQD16_gp005 [Aeromonas phage ZPAH34]UOX39450.1 hypothetical protein [Aeromonas phage ZPAH34]